MRINLGSGNTRYTGFTNVDITTKVDVDLIGSALDIPAADKSVAVVYHNAVFEHIFVAQHRLALQEADRVLAPGGVHIGLGIPDFQTLARLYLEGGAGLVGQRFDLYNAYRFTHGEPEQHRADWHSVAPTRPPNDWLAQIHKCLFDADYLHSLLEPWQHQVFRYRFKAEPFALNLGFVIAQDPLNVALVLDTYTPWVRDTVAEMDSLEAIAPSGQPVDKLSGLWA